MIFLFLLVSSSSSVLNSVQADNSVYWLKDLISPRGWDFGYGITLKINENGKGKEVPMMERLSLDVNLGELVGVSVNKAKSEGVELDFFVNRDVESSQGRSKGGGGGGKGGGGGGGRYVFPLLIGYKFAIMIGAGFGLLKLLALKGIFLAKLALIISIYLLTKHKSYSSEVIEVEQHHSPPTYHTIREPSHNFYGFHPGHYGGGDPYNHYAQPSNLHQDVAYAPSATASGDSQTAYAANQEDSNGLSVIPLGLERSGKDVERKAYFKKRNKGGANAVTIKS